MTDGLPALALGMEEADPGIMRRKPRPRNEQIFSGISMHLLVASLVSSGCTFLLFLFALSQWDTIEHARTLAFTFSILFEIFLAFHSRSMMRVWRIGMFGNKWLNVAALLPFFFQALLLLTPLRHAFQLTPLSWMDVVLLCVLGILGFLFLEWTKPFFGRHSSVRLHSRLAKGF
jgi:Ca2+-transporting ATPase